MTIYMSIKKVHQNGMSGRKKGSASFKDVGLFLFKKKMFVLVVKVIIEITLKEM